MPRDLFGDVHHPTVHVGSRSRYTVPLSLAAHALAILAVAGVTILGPVVLPGLASSDLIYTLVSVPAAPLPPAPRLDPAPATPAPNPNAAPIDAPDGVAPEPAAAFDLPEVPTVPGLVPGGSIVSTVVEAPPPPAPPAPEKHRVGGEIRPPTKVHDVAPVYPAMAQAARVQGTVIIEATIDTAGRVQSTRVLRSIPLLDEAALTAVRQWVYTPTLLNGTPVPVVMSVTVTFALR